MKSKASSPSHKSPSRESLLQSAAEQFLLRARRQRESAQDEVPPGWYTVLEIARAIKKSPTQARILIVQQKLDKKMFRRLTTNGRRINLIPYYKL